MEGDWIYRGPVSFFLLVHTSPHKVLNARPKCTKCDIPLIPTLPTKESYTNRRTVQVKSCSLYSYLHPSFVSFIVQIYSFALGFQRHTLFSYIRVRSHGPQQGQHVYNHTKKCHCHCQSASCFKLLC